MIQNLVFNKNDSNIDYYKLIIDLSLTELEDYIFYYQRKYYFVKYKTDAEIIFSTSNEPEDLCNPIQKTLDEDFTVIKDFENLFEDLNSSLDLNFIFDNAFNFPPKYIFYDINFIDDDFKPILLKDLIKNTEGYNEGDFDFFIENRIDIWKEYLSE